MIRVNCAFDIDFRLDFFLSFKYRLLCECYLNSSFRCFVFHIVFLFLGDRDLIKKLILQDVDLNVTDKNGQTPIFAACRKGVVAFIHLYFKFSRFYVFFWNLKGHAGIVELLARNDADINHQDIYGNSPISIATQNGNYMQNKYRKFEVWFAYSYFQPKIKWLKRWLRMGRNLIWKMIWDKHAFT